MARRLTLNQEVGGSTPSTGAKVRRVFMKGISSLICKCGHPFTDHSSQTGHCVSGDGCKSFRPQIIGLAVCIIVVVVVLINTIH
jgi:hypothetical protein